MPHVTRVERIKFGFDNSIRFKNNSKKKHQCMFEISCDRPDMMKLRRKTVELRGKEDTDVFFDIAPSKSNSRGMVRTHLYVQCAELVMHEVIAIDIEYPGK